MSLLFDRNSSILKCNARDASHNKAYKLYREAHSIKGQLTDEEFFVENAGGDPQPTIASTFESKYGELPEGLDAFAGRNYIIDSGASFHLVASGTLSREEKATMKYVGRPIPITTANGEVKVHAQVRVYVKELEIYVWAYVLDCDVAVLSLGMLCDEEGFTYQWVPNRPPTLVKDDFTVTCYPSNNVPIVFPAALLTEGDLFENESEQPYTEVASKKTKKSRKNTATPAMTEGDLAKLIADAPKRRGRSRP